MQYRIRELIGIDDFSYCIANKSEAEIAYKHGKIVMVLNDHAGWASARLFCEYDIKPLELALSQRSENFHISLKANASIWECGKTPEEAIDNLIKTHPRIFPIGREGIKVEYIFWK